MAIRQVDSEGKVLVQVRLPNQVARKLDLMGADVGMSRVQIIERLIREAPFGIEGSMPRITSHK